MSIPGDSRKKAPKKWVFWTKIAIVSSLVVLLGWDVVVANNPWRGDTVSELTIWAVLRSLTLSVALGYVSGHLTWPGKKKRPLWLVMLSASLVLAVCLTLDVLTWYNKIDWKALDFVRAWPPLSFIPSYVLGRLLWPQVRT